jgi:hypothetical protein
MLVYLQNRERERAERDIVMKRSIGIEEIGWMTQRYARR